MTTLLPPQVAVFLDSHNVMTLATQGEDGPWGAAVFYAWTGSEFVFLSAPHTRHAEQLARDPRCAATIQDDTADWKAVKGIQVEGRVERLEGKAATRARSAYGVKFPIALPGGTVPLAIAEALSRVAWYRLVPLRMYFIDNAKGFGQREVIEFGT